MAAELLFRYLHFLSIIVVSSALLGQHLILKGTISRARVAVAQRFDLAYGIAAAVVVVTGLAQWLWVGKPAAYYSSNPLFHTKFTLFLVIGIVSIYPSIFLGRNRKGKPADEVIIPGGVVWSVRIELMLLLLLPLLATLIAKGIGIPMVN